MWLRLRVLVPLLFAAVGSTCHAAGSTLISNNEFASLRTACLVTNTAQFRTLTAADYLDGCDFRLTGVVTFVDPGRDLAVLQDASGAVALHFTIQATGLRFGQQVLLEGTNCCPYIERFPDYPYNPTVREIRSSFEAPSGCGDYYLTRMRGYLRPMVTGAYSFWIASDNSSELWLSTDTRPSQSRKIAFIPRFNWVAPREWSRFPSQHSEPVFLQAGKSYYIEAIQEQTTVGDNLAVAWQGPGMEQSVIDGRYLTPYNRESNDSATNGILREFWTNYVAGDLVHIADAGLYHSILSVEKVGVHILNGESVASPRPIDLQSWQAKSNYQWVAVEGTARFIAINDNTASFELINQSFQTEVRARHLDKSFLERMHDARVHVEGVCEGIYDKDDNLAPGIIWTSDENNIRVLKNTGPNVGTVTAEPTHGPSTTPGSAGMQGFYSTRGIVTFNDRVFDKNYLVVQEDESAVLVSGGETSFFQKNLKVGEWVELGGALRPGKNLPSLAPLVISQLGLHAMPVPAAEPLGASILANRAGKWSEVEGLVHAVRSNGTLFVATKEGPAYFWIGHIQGSELANYVDEKLRVRGVLLPNMPDGPLLLIPSRNYVDVEEPAPEKPFEIATSLIAGLSDEAMEPARAHRVKITGEVTFQDAHSLFLQDDSGGIGILSAPQSRGLPGKTVEVIGFPKLSGSVWTLTEPLVRTVKSGSHISPKNLDLGEALSARQNATLVIVNATLLAQKTNGSSQVLELQKEQRVFAATLAVGNGNLPKISPGSRIQVVGVCDNSTTTLPLAVEKLPSPQYLASLNILMRSPSDLKIIRGPPWWTWQRTVTLVGALLMVIAVTLLWVHLLRRRLERQHAAQLAFSRQVLERLEDERRRIAINLHDSLGQILLAIKNQALLAIQRPPNEEGNRQRLEEISGATSQAIEEVRQITHGLRPYQLDRLGLAQAIRASINRASTNSQILFATRVEDIDGVFDKEAEIHVYRIVQEALTNVVKHSDATEAAVVIKRRDGAVSISIRDNGRGFDPAKLSSEPHDIGYGLSGMAERVRILGGTVAVDSRPGEGTSLSVEVPLPNSKHDPGSSSSDCR